MSKRGFVSIEAPSMGVKVVENRDLTFESGPVKRCAAGVFQIDICAVGDEVLNYILLAAACSSNQRSLAVVKRACIYVCPLTDHFFHARQIAGGSGPNKVICLLR